MTTGLVLTLLTAVSVRGSCAGVAWNCGNGNIWCYDCLDLFLEGGANREETETEEDRASKSF